MSLKEFLMIGFMPWTQIDPGTSRVFFILFVVFMWLSGASFVASILTKP